MYLRTALICIFFQSAAAADTISSLTLDWNDDGFADIARLDHSPTVTGRADLLLFEGTANGPGSELVEVAPDFARVPSHPNMDLRVVQGSGANQIEVIETGKVAGPDLWSAKTSIRFDGQTFVVDRHETDQELLAIWEVGSSRCVVDFIEKFAGGGDDVMADLAPLDADPMPLVRWSASTFLQIMQNVGSGECVLFEETYQSIKDTGITMEGELTLDWNNDGHKDHVILLDKYSHHILAIFMGDETGNARLTWNVHNIGPSRSRGAALRIPPGQRGVVEVSVIGREDREGIAPRDTAIPLLWQNGEPVITGLTVWNAFEEEGFASRCEWYFERGKFISYFTKAWVDAPEFASVYALSEWENVDLQQLIFDCRP